MIFFGIGKSAETLADIPSTVNVTAIFRMGEFMTVPASIVIDESDSTEREDLSTLLQDVFSSTRVSSFFQHFWSMPYASFIVTKDGLSDKDNQAFGTGYIPYDYPHLTHGVLNETPSVGFVNISSRPIGMVDLVNGNDRQSYLKEEAFHEFAHALTAPILHLNPFEGHDRIYAEQIAVFATNAIYCRENALHERVGHNDGGSAVTGTSSAQTGYFSMNDSFQFIVGPSRSAIFRTVDNGLSGYDPSYAYTNRTYWNDVSFDGNRLYGYITMERVVPNGTVFSVPGWTTGAEAKTEIIMDQSMVAGGIESSQRASLMAQQAQNQITLVHTALENFFGDDVIDFGMGVGVNKERAVFVSNERFIDDMDKDGYLDTDRAGFVNADGPAPTKFYIVDQNATIGSYILGGGGYQGGGVIKGIFSDSPRIDLTGAVDVLKGGSGSDIIAIGTGHAMGMKNEAWGGIGDDVLIGRGSSDALHGGIGDDFLIGGGGSDLLDGGDGFDILSYSNMQQRVIVTGSSSATIYGVSSDTIKDIEVVLGTNYDDQFISNGNLIMFGGSGKDTFVLSDGDVAFGGGEGDVFIISSSQGGRMAIGDFQGDDEIYVDGFRFTGEPRSYSWRKEGDDTHFDIVETITIGGSFDPRVLERVVAKQTDGVGSFDFYDTSYETNPFVEVGPDNGKSLEFGMYGNTGLFKFHNGSETTELLVSNITGMWGETFFDFSKETWTDIHPYWHDGMSDVSAMYTYRQTIGNGANFGMPEEWVRGGWDDAFFMI